MPNMKILLTRKNEPPAIDLGNHPVIQAPENATLVVALREGAMAPSGNHSITMAVELPDGKIVIIETSLKLWELATSAFRGAVENWKQNPL